MRSEVTPKFYSIAITGYISSGSTTLAKLLTERLGWKLVSVGEEVRKIFAEHGWNIEQTEKMPPGKDREIEARMRRMMQNGKNLIYEGHLAGWNTRDLPHVLRVLCVASPETQVERFVRREGIKREEALKVMEKRDKGLTRNFKKLYNVRDRFDPKYFHLVLDTGKMTTDQEAEEVIRALNNQI